MIDRRQLLALGVAATLSPHLLSKKQIPEGRDILYGEKWIVFMDGIVTATAEDKHGTKCGKRRFYVDLFVNGEAIGSSAVTSETREEAIEMSLRMHADLIGFMHHKHPGLAKFKRQHHVEEVFRRRRLAFNPKTKKSISVIVGEKMPPGYRWF